MAHHHVSGSPYSRLAERLNRFPQGAPASKLLFDILRLLMTEKEAGLMAQLPIKPFTARQAAERFNGDGHFVFMSCEGNGRKECLTSGDGLGSDGRGFLQRRNRSRITRAGGVGQNKRPLLAAGRKSSRKGDKTHGRKNFA